MNEAGRSGLVLHIAWVRWWSALAYHALTIARGLDQLGRPSRVLAPPGTPLAVRAAAMGLASSRWSDLVSSRPDRVIGAIRSLRRAAREGAVSALLVHTGPGHAAAALALRGGPAPLVRVRSDIRRPARGPVQRWLYSKATDRIWISGEFMRGGYLEGLGIDPGRIDLLPAGIDCREAERIDRTAAGGRLRAEHGWSAQARVVGMLARYSPVKGHEDFVQAARILAEGREDVYFLSAGPTGQVGREGVEAWVRGAGLSRRFAILDAVEDPLSLAAGLDVAVIPSRGSEAVCRSALEYMALGLPVVATQVHVIPETIGDAGLLVPPADPPALSRAIQELLDDPERAGRLGEAAARRVRDEFEIGRIAARAAALIDEAWRDRNERD